MKLKTMTLTALFAALCVIGGFIKIPSGIGSLALDTVPALLAASFLPPALVGFASMSGHIASAMYAGFPLGPVHVMIAIEMFLILFVFARMHKAGRHTWKWIFFIIANGLLAPLPLALIVSPAFLLAVLPSILLATILNAAVAIIVMPALTKVTKGRMGFTK
ncbi:ECF transporter S component [Sporosarcina sp. Sa2YVA2]|uniref:ECF transporter S component n=1 Tax=Sporosarcina quadrami TaxID=2762234 RepID=A0ABR8UAD0_9BACL|nr:ECF transporter S component [Sporosarcina quadrami]MBD7984673.1 ECF transporter S component [Sporosarcina quadrami]